MSNALTDFATRKDSLPRFSAVDTDSVAATIKTMLAEHKQAIDELVTQAEFSWSNFITPLEKLDAKLDRAWSMVTHLHAVQSTEAIREAYSECLPMLTAFSTWVGQHAGLYKAYESLKSSPAFTDYTPAQKMLVEHAIRDFKLTGVHLSLDKKQTLETIEERLSKLSNEFEERVLDATDNWEYLVNDLDLLQGLPKDTLATALHKGKEKGHHGALLTLDHPCYIAVMTTVQNRAIREKLYHAHATRASHYPYDNSETIIEILKERNALAELLDFDSFCDYSLASKMAANPDEVFKFLNQIADRVLPTAKEEIARLKALALDDDIELAPWDVAFYSEKLKKQTLDFDEEMLRPYFPLPHVLEGFFTVANRLFNISFELVKEADLWHDACSCYALKNNNKSIGYVYVDFCARQQKRGGAWMDECQNRFKTDEELELPIAFVTCNFPPAQTDTPALLSHYDVLTLFHEFGHALHHLLTDIDHPPVGGVHGVPWDAVEVPSQLLEQWCFEKDILQLISKHYKTGEVIPDHLIEKLQASQKFQMGMHIARQLEFALFDFTLHAEFDSKKGDDQVQAVLDKVRKQVSVFIPPDYHRFQHSFTHVFGGSYCAGYYSYLWAEVLALDIYSVFKEKGYFERSTGQEFLEKYLSKGGSVEPLELFSDFCGRTPNIEALFTTYDL